MRYVWVLPLILLSAGPLQSQKGPCTEEAVKQGNMQLSDDAFSYMPPYGKPVIGRAETTAADKKSFSDRSNGKRSWRDDHRIVSSDDGKMAFERGTMHMSYDSKSEGHVDFDAVILAVYRAKGGECQQSGIDDAATRRKAIGFQPEAALSSARAAATFAPSGEPSPVHGSHPGPAVNAPLFPEVMSRKALGTA